MQSTPIRIGILALPVLVAAAACGQVTGLSNDYTYDLEGGASAADGATGDGATTDGTAGEGGDSGAPDATNKCSQSDSFKAAQRLSQFNGTQVCKTCLASSCCTDVDTCTSNGDCDHVLSCELDCTEKPVGQRSECFKQCTVNGGKPAVFTNGVLACASGACSNPCGLQ
jgi:hypothetical protein